jgi:hypothetical protein
MIKLLWKWYCFVSNTARLWTFSFFMPLFFLRLRLKSNHYLNWCKKYKKENKIKNDFQTIDVNRFPHIEPSLNSKSYFSLAYWQYLLTRITFYVNAGALIHVNPILPPSLQLPMIEVQRFVLASNNPSSYSRLYHCCSGQYLYI